MESPGGYPESPIDQDDVVYPCKGCGEILEEGKAFELAGNRWHIDCFRCNTCGTLLDSDANLLLLGDGSLICNNCTYSCNHCGNKIEDLAILTGDQAFCANCFRCRNCKRKIENLRYARTSQGIFCMSCHESLMARRRKKVKKPPAGPTPKVDKSLPALPPSAVPTGSAFTPELDTPSDVFSEPNTTDVSPRPPARRNDSSPANYRRDASPADESRRDNLTLPASTYKETTHSEASDAGGEDGLMLPFALDPNPVPGPSPIAKTQTAPVESKSNRDYFNRPGGNHRDMLKENRSRSASADRQGKSPHIAFQEIGRQPSDQYADPLRKRKDPAGESPAIGSNDRMRSQHASPAPQQTPDAFKLQEVPKNKRAEARKGSTTRSPSHGSPAPDMAGRLMSPADLVTSPTPVESQKGRDDSPATSGSSYTSSRQVERPARGDSLTNAASRAAASMKKDTSATSPTTPTMPSNERKPSNSTTYSQQNGSYNVASPADSLSTRSMNDAPVPPQRSAGRPAPASTDAYAPSRAPPQPSPAPQNHKTNESVSTVHSETPNQIITSGLPRLDKSQPDFSQDEDFVRLLSLQNQEPPEKEPSVLRKVSNAVSKSKHGRSFSDRGSINSPRHKKWPTNGSIDISSPTIPSPDSKEENVNLRNELRRAQQRIAELEAEKNGLEEAVHSHADIKQANTMLREKRNTMTVLDAQREMVIRELEIMTEQLKRAKDSAGPVNLNVLKGDIVRELGDSLEQVKRQYSDTIEELLARRTALTDEIANLIQMKDKGFQEYESLTAQNRKLQDMNNHLIESIQSTLKNNKQSNGNQALEAARSPANGLGIYHPMNKTGKSDLSVDAQAISHEPSYSNLHDPESEATLAQPQVVNIRKTGKATKFSNWKKGGQAISKGVSKGFKGAFGPSEHKRDDDFGGVRVIGTPYGSTHTQPDLASMSSVVTASTRSKEEPTPRGWFGGKTVPNKGQNERLKPMMHNNSSTNLVGENSSVLFGSDLSNRCEFEKRMIPAIVSRCIEEVESRGMDVEGIYRKSGGTSQVNQVKSSFEGNGDIDISDPDLDIHAVSSALKNYFRNLPVPLITFAVYEQFLEAGGIPNPDQKIKALGTALRELPRPHYDTLQFLVFHLSRVIQHSSVNLMTPLNLAVVFAPTIMRSNDVQRELTDMAAQRKAVEALLENHKNVFFEEQ